MYQLKQRRGILGIFAQKDIGAERRQCFQIHAGSVFGTVSIQQILSLSLFHNHMSACLGNTELTV